MGRIWIGISFIVLTWLTIGCHGEVVKHSAIKPTPDSFASYELNRHGQQKGDGAPTTDVNLRGATAIIKLREHANGIAPKHAMAWSPNGRMLAFVDDGFLVTYHPNRSLRLPKNSPDESMGWESIQWRPDGKQLIIDGPSTLVIDLHLWKVIKKVDYPQILWWFGNSLATSKVVESSDSRKKVVRTWTTNGVTHKLPSGIQPLSASRDGRAIIGHDEDYENKWLLIINPQSGKVSEKWTFLTPGRTDSIEPLGIDWNEKRRLAAHLIDSGGGGTVWAYVSHSNWESGVFYDNQVVFGGVETPHWLDDRWLCLKFITTEKMKILNGLEHTYDLPRIGLYDAETSKLRTVYIDDDMVDIAPSRDHVAILEQSGGVQQIVITDWVKTRSGEIITTKYKAADASLSQYLNNGIMLKKQPAKASRKRDRRE